jgi:hypothetical protein
MQIEEGAPFDWNRIYESLHRINSLGLFDPLTGREVQVTRDTPRQVANLTITVKQAAKGRWALSGPAGPLSISGPLRGHISSRLPGWGSGLLELSTYHLTIGITGAANPLFRLLPFAPERDWLPYVSLERPFLPGQSFWSGFFLSPQMSGKSMLLNYGSTQVHRRIRRFVRNDAPVPPPLVVPIRLGGNDTEPPATALVCEPPKPRLPLLRSAGLFALDWALGRPLW